MVRMDEILESLHILEQLIDNIHTETMLSKPNLSYDYRKVHSSRWWKRDVAPLVCIESKVNKTPYLEIPFFVPSFSLSCRSFSIWRQDYLTIAIGGTLDYVVPDIDR